MFFVLNFFFVLVCMIVEVQTAGPGNVSVVSVFHPQLVDTCPGIEMNLQKSLFAAVAAIGHTDTDSDTKR